MNTIVIQRAEPMPGYEYDAMLNLTSTHHDTYCRRQRYEYDCKIVKSERHEIMQGGWEKIQLIREALEDGYDNVIWLDADTMIVDTETPLTNAIEPGKIGACWHRIPQINHWNVGALYIHNTPSTREFIAQWFAQPNPRDGWNEQGIFNRMGRASKVVVTLSDKWNATIDVSIVPDAVVLGFHGQLNRYQQMRQAFNKLFPMQETVLIPSEVSNG